MDFDEFREFGHASIEFIINYLSSIRDRCVHVFVCDILEGRHFFKNCVCQL